MFAKYMVGKGVNDTIAIEVLHDSIWHIVGHTLFFNQNGYIVLYYPVKSGLSLKHLL